MPPVRGHTATVTSPAPRPSARKLPGTATSGERGACLSCVQKKEKHHYHPDYKQGERCRPDDGKP